MKNLFYSNGHIPFSTRTTFCLKGVFKMTFGQKRRPRAYVRFIAKTIAHTKNLICNNRRKNLDLVFE